MLEKRVPRREDLRSLCQKELSFSLSLSPLYNGAETGIQFLRYYFFCNPCSTFSYPLKLSLHETDLNTCGHPTKTNMFFFLSRPGCFRPFLSSFLRSRPNLLSVYCQPSLLSLRGKRAFSSGTGTQGRLRIESRKLCCVKVEGHQTGLSHATSLWESSGLLLREGSGEKERRGEAPLRGKAPPPTSAQSTLGGARGRTEGGEECKAIVGISVSWGTLDCLQPLLKC